MSDTRAPMNDCGTRNDGVNHAAEATARERLFNLSLDLMAVFSFWFFFGLV